MIIYEVNLAVDEGAADEFAAWLGPHIAEMLAIEGFVGAEWFERDRQYEAAPPAGRRLWTVRYELRDRESLEAYVTHHAARMRDEGMRRFAGRFQATRRVMSPV